MLLFFVIVNITANINEEIVVISSLISSVKWEVFIYNMLPRASDFQLAVSNIKKLLFALALFERG